MSKTRVSLRFIIFFGVLLCVSIGALYFFLLQHTIPKDRLTIELRRDGFYPKELLIREGETVTFHNSSGKSFWPASNMHPSHEIYGEFDSKQPIASRAQWKFTFNRSGRWRYHDHMYPEFTGVVSVLAPGQTVMPPLDCQTLIGTSVLTKQQCWDELLTSAFERKGLKGAFEEFTRLYSNDMDFVRSGCHVHAHQLGHIFFQEFAKNGSVESVDFPSGTASCGYGFYHGLFEHYFRRYPDTALIRKICDSLDKKYGKSMPLMRVNCFHGSGHGLVPDPPDVALWGKPEQIIIKPLALCNTVSTNEGEVEQCIEGIFNVLVDWTWRNQYGMSVNTHDPFWLCKKQSGKYKEPCYYEWVKRLEALSVEEFINTVQTIVVPIGDIAIEKLAVGSLAASFIQYHILTSDYTELITACRGIPTYLLDTCIDGLTNGFRSHGSPGKEYEKAVSFCRYSGLSESERTACFDGYTKNLWYSYPQSKVKDLCADIEEPYNKGCKTNPRP